MSYLKPEKYPTSPKKNKINMPSWVVFLNKHDYPIPVISIDNFKGLKLKNSSIVIDEIEPERLHGFIYLIEFSDGKYYLGKKNFYSERKVAKGKKELEAMTDKRGSKKKIVKKESDWLYYFGSFKDKEFLDKLQKGEVKIKSRSIIEVAYTKSQLTYLETKYLFSLGVIESEKFLNDNILGKFYRKSLEN